MPSHSKIRSLVEVHKDEVLLRPRGVIAMLLEFLRVANDRV